MKYETITFSIVWPALCAGLTILILWLSLMPSEVVPTAGLGWDKLNHATAIAMITSVAFLAFRNYKRAAWAAFSYGISLGVLIEVLQGLFTTTRSAEWGDLLADLVGAVFVLFIICIFQLKREHP